jgi:hypothetical protein
MTQQMIFDNMAVTFPAGYDGIVIRFDEHGYTWGNSTTGELVCLGLKNRVLQAIHNPKLKTHNPDIDQLVELERKLIREEQENNGKQPNIQKPGAFRSRITREVKHRAAAARRIAPGKRLPVHPVKHQMPGILGR